MRTDIVRLIHDQAPKRPACFETHNEWTQWLVGAHEAGMKVVRREDLGKHAGHRVTTFKVLPVGQQSHCVECSQRRRDTMKAAGRCFPVAVARPAPAPVAAASPRRAQFEVEGVATLIGLRVLKKKGAEDSRLLTVRLAVEFPKVDAKVCAHFDEMLVPFLYRQELAGRVVRNTSLRPVAYTHQLQDAQVEVDRQTFPRADVHNFVITPIDGASVTLGCVVTLYPGKANVSHLIDRVQEGVRMRIVGAPDLFDDVDEEPASKPKAQLALT